MTIQDQQIEHSRTLRVPRTRGAVSGVLLILLGAWGALVPFVGPYFGYSFQSEQTWLWSSARLWLEVLPGGVTTFGGLLLLLSTNRVIGSLGGWLAAAAGLWFIIGQTLATWLRLGPVGTPVNASEPARAATQLGYFYGLGAVILFLAAFALGRLAVVGVRDLRAARRREQRQRGTAVIRPQAEDEQIAAREADDPATVPSRVELSR